MKKETANRFSSSPILIEHIMDSISSAVFLIDQKKDILKYNKAFVKMFSLDFSLNENKCFKAINIQSKKSGVEYFKIRFKPEDNDEESQNCVLNMAVNKAINEGISTEKQIVGDDYFVNGELKHLYLQFTVKPLDIDDERYILVTMEDISEFETAKLNLLKNNMQIKRYNNMYKNELQMAKQVQHSILPKKLFVNEDFRIDFRYFPLGEIGGDYFDFFKIDDKNIGLIICDVAGHGIPSALITTMLKTMVESARNFYLSPKRLVKYINNQVIKILENCFLTMIYGVVNIPTGMFTYVRAGHPKPWLIKEDAVSTMGLKNNMLLGVDEKAKFEEDRICIEKNSKMILYTDGLIDIGRKNSGYEKEIMNLLKKEAKLDTCALLNKVGNNIQERLKDEKHQDDICVIIVERL